MVTLHSILPESDVLHDSEKVREYLENTIPLHFEEGFPGGADIEEVPETEAEDRLSCPGETHLQRSGDRRAPKLFGLEKPELGEIKVDGRILGYYWACQNARREKLDSEAVRGLQIRKKGFAIGTRASVLEIFSKDTNLIEWWTGEIHVLGSGLIPDAQRARLEPTPNRVALEEWIRGKLGPSLATLTRIKAATGKAEDRIKRAQDLPLRPHVADYAEWRELFTDADRLEDQLTDDAYSGQVAAATKARAVRAIERVKTHIEALNRIRPSPPTDSAPAEKPEQPPPPRRPVVIPRAKESSTAGYANREAVAAAAAAEARALCSRAGRPDSADLLVDLLRILIEERFLSDTESVRKVLGRLEHSLSAG